MLHLDRYAYSNSLVGVDPAEKFFFSVATLITCLALNTLAVSVTVIFLMTVITVLRGRVPFPFYFKLMLLPISFLLVGTLTIAINVVREPYDMLWGIQLVSITLGITTESMNTAGKLFLRALAAVSCLYFLTLTTPLTQIIFVLRRLKCPEMLLELMNLTYRYIFVLLETAEKIYSSQAARLGYADVKKGYLSTGYLATSLFIRSYQRSLDLYTALEARCYNGKLEVLEQDYRISKKNLLVIIISQLLLISIALLDGGII